MVDFPWGCSSLPRVTPPLQRELLRLILSSCRSPREPTSASLQEVSRDGAVQGAKPQIRAGSKSLLISYSKVVDLEPFRPPAGPGPIRAVFGPPRTRTSRRPERRTGTRVQRDDPSFKVHDDEHDDELDDDDDDDAANDFKISSKDPRCPEVKVGVPKPTSGHQELHHDASSQDIAPSKISELENRIPKPTSGHQELDRKSRPPSESRKSSSEKTTTSS